MVAVNVRDEYQIRLWQSVEALAAADRVRVNRLVLPTCDKRGVVDGVDDYIAVTGGDAVAFESVLRRRQAGQGNQR